MLAFLISAMLGQTFQVSPGFVIRQAAPVTYSQAASKAAREGKPLVVFVGRSVRPIRGAVVHSHWESTPDWPMGEIVVIRPKLGIATAGYYLGPDATDAEIQKWGAELSPRPFLRKLRLRAGLTVDDDDVAAGPWPEFVKFTEGLVLYKPAEWTQAIATRDGRPAIDKVHRSALPSKWWQPGGMEGLTGWRSDLYKLVPPGWQTAWTARLPVLNSFGNFQHELGWTRSYPDGTEFHDVLSNAATGEIFEHRTRRKAGWQWESFVAYRNKDAYPTGYAGLKGVACASCHNSVDGPGTGGYGVGLVQGADTVISDPIDALER